MLVPMPWRTKARCARAGAVVRRRRYPTARREGVSLVVRDTTTAREKELGVGTDNVTAPHCRRYLGAKGQKRLRFMKRRFMFFRCYVGTIRRGQRLFQHAFWPMCARVPVACRMRSQYHAQLCVAAVDNEAAHGARKGCNADAVVVDADNDAKLPRVASYNSVRASPAAAGHALTLRLFDSLEMRTREPSAALANKWQRAYLHRVFREWRMEIHFRKVG